MEEKKKDNSRIVFILIILILLGVIGYLVFNNIQKSDEIEVKNEKIDTDSATIAAQTKELEELMLAYERVKLEREELGLSNDSLNKQIIELNEYIAQVKAGNAKKIRQLNGKIAQMKQDLDVKDAEISSLRLQNDSLVARVDTMGREVLAMNDSLNDLRNVKTSLLEQVAIASILKAENINVSVINSKGKEIAKEEFKAKNIDKLKVTFNLAENRVARKDKKNILLRVIEPSGAVLYDMATGGGFFTNSEGKEIPFTDKRSITFDNSKQQVSFVYLKGSPYKAGNYTLELIADGHKIGESSLIVK